jgi:hypothetical protein
MIELKWFPVNFNVASSTSYSNWVFANNTIAGSINGAFGIFKRDNLLTNVTLRSIRWANNITYDTYSWVGSIPHGRDRAGTGSWNGPPEEIFYDYNVMARGKRRGGPHQQLGSLELSLFGRKWPNAEALNRATIYKHNTSAPPRFQDEARHDYRLAPNDQVARNTGLDLSFLDLPGLEQDLYGNPRGHGGTWDRGAIEYAPAPSAATPKQ